MHDIEPMYTARLRLVPATLAHLDAELESHAALGRLLRAMAPAPCRRHSCCFIESHETKHLWTQCNGDTLN